MKQMRIIMGTLFFVSLMLGAIPIQAKTDPVTGMRVVKPYFFQAPDSESVSVVRTSAASTRNPTIVDPDKLRIRARLNFEPDTTYILSVLIQDVTVFDVGEKPTSDGYHSLTLFFNGDTISESALTVKGTIDLSNLSEGPQKKVLTNPDVKITSSGWSNGRDLRIIVDLINLRDSTKSITQTGLVRTSSR